MSDFYVGQEVVCVDAGNTPGRIWPNGSPIVAGAHYFVREVVVASPITGEPSLRLDNVSYDTRALGLDIPLNQRRFRPIKSETIQIFRDMCINVKRNIDA